MMGFEVRNRPDWLYDSLPYGYVAIGLVVIGAFGASLSSMNIATLANSDLPNIIGMLSGLLLVAAGMVVFHMRWTNRKAVTKFRAELAAAGQRDEFHAS
jgi:hypothetical protein